jgi:hypothetical protein
MGGLLASLVLAASLCGSGKPVLAVSYRVLNDVDIGVKGNTWAFDSYTRTVRVWRKSNRYCSSSSYDGEFTSLAGWSPGGKWQLPAGVRGTFKGSSRTTFRATFAPRGAPVRGFLGVKDFACTSADEKGKCSGTYDWLRAYFVGVAGFRYTRYQFRYRATDNGTGTFSDSLSAGKIRTNGDIKPAKSKP